MMTSTSVHAQIRAALTTAGLAAFDGPADDLPIGADGRVAQAVVLWPTPRLNVYTRSSGGRSGGIDRVTCICVGATTFDALAVADKVDAALGGLRISDNGGPLAQIVATTPELEPNADPARVSMAVEYASTTKD